MDSETNHTVEPLREGDRIQLFDLGRMAFGETRVPDPERPYVEAERTACVYDGDRVIAHARTHQYAQWFGGRPVPCGGVSGVMVATDKRSSGVGRAVMVRSIEAMRERGEVISALFPAVAPFYRRLGYENAGRWSRTTIALDNLPEPTGDVTWAPATYEATGVRSVSSGAGRLHDGWLIHPELAWQVLEYRRTEGGKTNGDVWVGERDGAPAATVAVHYEPSDDNVFDAMVTQCVGTDHAAQGDALSFLGRYARTATYAKVTTPPHVLDTHLVQPHETKSVDRYPWMFRLVDAPGAFAGRGWNPSVAGRVDIAVTDPLISANDANYQLTFDGGRVDVQPGGDGAVRADVTCWSAWYTGHLSLARARDAGHLAADDDLDLALLTAAVATDGPPTILDFF